MDPCEAMSDGSTSFRSRLNLLPDIPLGGNVRDIEVINATPTYVRQVVCNHGFVESSVELPVDEFRQASLLLLAQRG